MNKSFGSRRGQTFLRVLHALFTATICLATPTSADEDRSAYVVADAGRDRHASVGQTIQLDGSRSLSADGRALSFAWSVVSRPAGSAAALSETTAVRPKFTVDVAGDYVFALTARVTGDASAISATAHVAVSTANVAPVADAGLNRRSSTGSTIALDGARSWDADGDAITWSWTLVKKPSRSAAALSSAASARPTIRLDKAGTYVAELVVTDATGRRSARSRVAVSTKDAVAGRASAGPAQSLALGGTARLDADGSYLPDAGRERISANAAWALLSRPAGSAAGLALGADARQALRLDAAGDYVVQIMLRGADKCDDDDDFDDDHTFSQHDARLATTLVTTGNVAPVADAGPEQSFTPGTAVTLDGARSTDANGDMLTYRWALISRPDGSTATLDDPGAVRPEFVADVAGTYVAQLVVEDGHGAAAAATTVVTTAILRPVANAGPDPRGKAGAAAALDGSASVDPTGAPLAANWAILGLGDQPSVGALSAPTNLETNFNVPTAGVALAEAVLSGPQAVRIGDSDDAGPRGIDLKSVGRITGGGVSHSVWRIRNTGRNGRVATLDSQGRISA